MLVFSTSDKGGTGRSVTSCNVAYRLSQAGKNVAYVDFDLGSPTAGALFEVGAVERGAADQQGVHSYLLGEVGTVVRIDVLARTDRVPLRGKGPRSGRLVLLPGDYGGAEFATAANEVMVTRCLELLLSLEQEFDVVFVDLSAGRSLALDVALQATARMRNRPARWLIFHRWTRQHIIAASNLVRGPHGLLKTGAFYMRESLSAAMRETVSTAQLELTLLESVRYVRTAVPVAPTVRDPAQLAQSAWLAEQDGALKKLASQNKLGIGSVLGETPIEPMLQWREQVILDADVDAKIANQATAIAYTELARKLLDAATWERF